MSGAGRDRGVLVTHPTLNANVRQASLALVEADLLAGLRTSLAVGSRLSRLASIDPRLMALLERRRVPQEVAPFSSSHPAYEVRRVLARRVPALTHLLGDPSLHRMYAEFDARTARVVTSDLAAVLSYEDGAQETFAAAGRAGIPRIYDLPIPYWRTGHALLDAEAEANPSWAPLLGGLKDPAWLLDRKDRELESADLVLTASALSTLSVREVAPDKPLVQIPYGCPPPSDTIRPSEKGPLRVLYVGSLTQRKGLSYLFEAMRTLGTSAQLTVVGSGAPAQSDLLSAALAENTHIPKVPHQHMAAVMRRHDVLILPSLVEGFGLVINEALAQGLPVVATDRTGAAGLYSPAAGQDWLVPPGDSAAIAARLAAWASDRDALNTDKQTALDIARRNPWSVYRAGLREAVRAVIG
jgi:starch synthase